MIADNPLRWQAMDAQELQREYSPSSAIGGDIAPFIEQYVVESAKAYAASSRIETISYADKPGNTIDFSLPSLATQKSSSPLLLFIHGGYWQALSKKESFFGADWFANQGIAYGSLDYTLAPQVTLPEIVAECRSALQAVFSQADSLGIDPTRIYVAGSSAGAHLTAMCCTETDASHRIAGAILLSGIFELEPFVSISDNAAVGLSVEVARLNSPLLMSTETFPDTIISWGEHETLEFKRQSQAFGIKLKSQTRSLQIFESPARNHFDVVHDMVDTTTPLGKSIVELINKAG